MLLFDDDVVQPAISWDLAIEPNDDDPEVVDDD